jgi:prepilin-type N-terminal cleavage/methylation domain-containing protein
MPKHAMHMKKTIRKKTKFSRQAGFTLIELLVVISIMSLLASILLINTIGARAKARDTKRLQNMKTLSTALESFDTDNGAYPAGQTEFRITLSSASFDAYDLSNNGNFIPELVSNTYIGAPMLDTGDPATGRGVMYYINIEATQQYYNNVTTWTREVGQGLASYYCGGDYVNAPYPPMPKYLLVDHLEKLTVPKELQCKGIAGNTYACLCVY